MNASPSPSMFSFVDWTRAPDDLEGERFDALSSFMLFSILAHCGMLLGRDDALGQLAETLLLPAFGLSALVGVSWRRAKPACLALSFGVASVWLALAWPNFANHLVLEWSILLFLLLCRNDPELGMKAARWLIVVVLFHSGLQKFVMGQYFTGAFLAFNTATTENFEQFMGLVLSQDEFARIVAMGGLTGTGPYAVRDPLFLAMSNLVWIGEMGLALLLLVSKTRIFAMIAAALLIVAIELGAREVIFGCLFATLLLGFCPRKNALAVWPGLAAVQLGAMAIHHTYPGLGLN